MPEEAVRQSSHPVQKKGIIAKSLDLIFKILGLLVFSALISIAIEWTGMIFYYPAMGYEGYEHAAEMMREEIHYIGNSLEKDNLNGKAIENATNRVSGVVNWLFIDYGIIENLNKAKMSNPEDPFYIKFMKDMVMDSYNFLIAAIYILIVFFVRLSILILSIPAFVLFGLVGVCDGLMQRDLRRWCGGNESGFIYHWAKSFTVPTLVISWIIYLSIPFSVEPNFIITPFAVLFGLVLMVMSSKFKKYL